MRPVELSPFWERATVKALWLMPTWSYRYVWLETGRVGLDMVHTIGISWRGRRIVFAYGSTPLQT
jgi:hypothetical protein